MLTFDGFISYFLYSLVQKWLVFDCLFLYFSYQNFVKPSGRTPACDFAFGVISRNVLIVKNEQIHAKLSKFLKLVQGSICLTVKYIKLTDLLPNRLICNQNALMIDIIFKCKFLDN